MNWLYGILICAALIAAGAWAVGMAMGDLGVTFDDVDQ